jgi:hypothetical protein
MVTQTIPLKNGIWLENVVVNQKRSIHQGSFLSSTYNGDTKAISYTKEVAVRRRGQQTPDHDLEPYQPDYSPAVGHYPRQQPLPPVDTGRGFFGCLQSSIAITIISVVILVLIIGAIWILSIRATGDATASIFDSIGNIFNGGPNVTTVDVRQIVLAVRQEAWLETIRETQAVDVYAENEMPGVIPGKRSARYQAFVTVTAGVDLELVTEEDFVVDGQTVTITLPNAQLKDCILDQESSRYYDKSCTILGCGGLEEVLLQSAMETAATQDRDRILEEAFNQAAEYVQNLGRNFGFSEVVIQRDSSLVSPVAEGGTCLSYTPEPTPMPSPTASQ